MAWIAIMPGVYAGVPDEVQAEVAVKAEAETTGDWWEFEALEHDASELA